MTALIEEIYVCRVCGHNELIDIVNLDKKPLTGVFLKPDEPDPLSAPLNLVCCTKCKFLQLKHEVKKDLMYSSYYYRSGTNNTMTNHLGGIVEEAIELVDLKEGDIVIDSGCNDGTLLKFYNNNLKRIGVDPSNAIDEIDDSLGIIKINDFFYEDNIKKHLNNEKAKIITSISMFYDISDPTQYVSEIKSMLADDGIWIVEMNYTGCMIESLGYDMISHEHIAYYTLLSFEYLMKKCEMFIFDVTQNSINGGSIRLFIKKTPGETNNVTQLRNEEIEKGYHTLDVYKDYKKSIENFKHKLLMLINKLKDDGSSIMGYGASTRGNTIMQHCELTRNDITAVLDRNPIKYGLEMSGCRIPIISEIEGRKANPDYLIILPYYFLDEFINREIDYLKNGGKFIVFLPELRILSWENNELKTKYI